MMADALLKQLGRPAFSWGGGGNLVSANAVRARYLAALQQGEATIKQMGVALATQRRLQK